MEKEFVKYNQALALRELGFNEPCLGYYVGKDKEIYVSNKDVMAPFNPDLDSKVMFRAPTYSQAFRWFREKYKLHSYIYSDYSWNISGGIWDLNGYKDLRYDWDSEPYAAYEEAESACLDKLIEIVKNKQD